MVYRTLIGTYAPGDLRIRGSKPLFDVTMPLDPERLAFDSAWTDVGVVYTRGEILVPAVPALGYVQVNFDDVLTSPPFVICYRKMSSTVIRSGSDISTATALYRPYFYSVTTSYIRFWPNYPGVADANSSYVACYTILRSMV